MYSVFKSKKLWFSNKSESPITFGCFFDNQSILFVFQNGMFSIINIQSSHPNKEIFSSNLPSNTIVIDCKRILANTCAILTQNANNLIILRLDSHEVVFITQISIAQGALLNINSISKIIPFDHHQFAIMEELYQAKSINLLIFTLKDQQSLKFTTTTITEEIQWVSSNYEIVKTIEKSKQFAIYKQKQVAETSWKIRFISINQEYQQKCIDLHAFLTEEHTVCDIIVKDTNQYYIFAKRCSLPSNKEMIEVWRSRLHNNHGNYIQSCEIITNYGFNNTNLIEIICINYEMGYFLTKNLAYEEINGEIYNNTLEIVNLQTGNILQKLYCNLKSLDISSNKEIILDYSQQINSLDRIGIHLRKLINKKTIYSLLLQHSTVLAGQELSRSFQAQILSFL